MIGRSRRLLWPGAMAAAMLAGLLGLGTWQVERLHWKQALLAQIARAETAPAVPLPAEPDPFIKVQVTGRLREDLAVTYGAEVRETPAGPQLGTQLIVPLEKNGWRYRPGRPRDGPTTPRAWQRHAPVAPRTRCGDEVVFRLWWRV